MSTFMFGIEDLINHYSMQVIDGMNAVFPQYKRHQVIRINGSVRNFPNCYAVRGSVLAFIHEGKFYVTPFINGAIEILQERGFKEASFLVPFSNGDYPYTDRDRWNELCKKAHSTVVVDFEERCRKFCDEKGIKRIRGEYITNSLRIPANGVKVSHHFFGNTYYPLISTPIFDKETLEYIGTFHEHNKVVVFVYRDGNTYVTKGDKIVSELLNCGYKERKMFVPLSNGENIEDTSIKERWSRIYAMN